MSTTLSNLLSQFDRHPESIPLDELIAELTESNLCLDDVQEFVCFSEEAYQRHLMHVGPGYQALILCWRSGQRSPIHDHRGSACGVRVLTGVLSETVFERNSGGLIFPTRTSELGEGDVCGSFDNDIHQVSNLQPAGQDLVTLHIYSPPLLAMGTYSLTDDRVGEYVPPVHEFTHGAGI